MENKKRVFLGGTCNESKWRKHLIPMLEEAGIDYFNPVVDDWTPECMAEEIKQRKECDYVLYVITPRMTGVYSIAEVVDDSNKHPEKTLLFILDNDTDDGGKMKIFDKGQMKSLDAVAKLVYNNKGIVCNSFDEIISVLTN
uniref:Putative nucleoside deoxyribosyltransferase n=1 Tax=viral metagenome TaxID=1070528 RepID=A0A6M3M4N1_9ZZZZ